MTISANVGNLFVNSSGTWAYPSAIKAMQGNVWTPVQQVYVFNSNSEWELVWPTTLNYPWTWAVITVWYEQNTSSSYSELDTRWYVHAPTALRTDNSTGRYFANWNYDNSYSTTTYHTLGTSTSNKWLTLVSNYSGGDLEYYTWNWANTGSIGSTGDIGNAADEIGHLFRFRNGNKQYWMDYTHNYNVYGLPGESPDGYSGGLQKNYACEQMIVRLDALKYLYPNEKVQIGIWGQWQNTPNTSSVWSWTSGSMVPGTKPVNVNVQLLQGGAFDKDQSINNAFAGIESVQQLTANATVSSTYTVSPISRTNTYSTTAALGDHIGTFTYDCQTDEVTLDGNVIATPSNNAFYYTDADGNVNDCYLSGGVTKDYGPIWWFDGTH